MKTTRASHPKTRRPSICTGSIATMAVLFAQASPFVPSASADTSTVVLGSNVIYGAVTGPDFLKLGGGTTFLSTDATGLLTGTTTVRQGSLVVTVANQLGSSAVVVEGDASRGNCSGNLTVGGAITLSNPLTLRGFGLGGDSGALTNVGNNTYSGPVVISLGAQTRLLSSFGTGTVSGGVTLAQGQTTQFAGNAGWTVTGVVAGGTSAAVQKIGAGSLELTNTNTYGGISTVTAGFLRVASGANLGGNVANNAIQLQGGLFEIRGNAPSFTGKGVTNNTATGTIFADHAVGSSVQNQTADFRILVQSDANRTTTLNGRNGYGMTFGAGGTASSVTVNQAGNATINNNTNGLVTYNGNFWNLSNITTRSFSLGGTGNSVLNGNILAPSTGTGQHTITKSGTGTFTINSTGTGSSLTGPANVTGGTLAVNAIAALNNAAVGAGSSINLNGGTLAFVGATGDYTVAKTVNLSGTGTGTINANQIGSAVTISSFTATGTGNKQFTLGGSNTLDNTFSAAIVNPSIGQIGLVKSGNGKWVLSGASTYTGNTTINDGTLTILANATPTSTVLSTGTGGLIFANDGGTLEFNNTTGGPSTQAIGGSLTPTAGQGTLSLTGTSAASLTFGALGAVGVNSGLNVAVGANGGTVTVTGVPNGFVSANISYDGADFAKATGGTGLLAALAYDGTADDITAGATLVTGSHNRINGAPSSTVGADTVSSLKIDAQTVTLGGLLTITTGLNTSAGILAAGAGTSTITGGGILSGSTAGSIVVRVDTGSTLNMDTPLSTTGTSGATGLTKNGSGLLVLSQANTQRGTTTINEGTLQLAAGLVSTLAASGQGLTIRDGASLDVNGRPITVNALNNNGTITNSDLATVTITAGQGNTAGTSVGSIIQTAGVINFTKNGTGTTTLNGVSNYTGVTTMTSTGLVATSTLQDGLVASGIGASVSAASSLVFNSGASTTGSQAGLSYTGAASVSTDRLFTIANNTANAGARILANGANNASLVFSNTGPIVVSGTAGAKTLTLGGGSTGDNTMNPQIVDGSGTAVVGVRKQDAGLWILGNGSNSYTGPTVIVNGMLQAVDGGSLPTASSLTIGNSATGTTGSTAIFQSTGSLGAGRTIGTNLFVGTGTGVGLGANPNQNAGFAASTGKFIIPSTVGTATWGTPSFMAVGQEFLLNSSTALGEVDYQGAIDLNGASRTVNVLDNGNAGTDLATISGAITGAGTAGLIRTGAGFLQLTGANSYTGNTELRTTASTRVTSLGQNAGVGTSSVGAWGANPVLVSIPGTSAILTYVGAGETSSREIQLAGGTTGSVIESSGSGALVLSNVVNSTVGPKTLTMRGDNSDSNEITSILTDNIVGSGTAGVLSVSKTEGGVWTLSGASTYTGNTTAGGGLLGIGAATAGVANAVTSGPLGTALLVMGNGSIFADGAPRTVLNSVQINNNSTSGFAGENSITIDSTVTVTNGNNTNNYNNFIKPGSTLTINGTLSHNDPANNKTQNFAGPGDTVINGLITQGTTGNLNLQVSGFTATGSVSCAVPSGTGNTLGTVTLTNAANSYNGSTNVAGGTLILAVVGGIPNTGTASTLNLSGGYLQAAIPAAGTIPNPVLVNAGTNGFVGGAVSGPNSITFTGSVTNNGGNRSLVNEFDSPQQLNLNGPVFLSESNVVRTFTLTGKGDTTINGLIGNSVTGTAAGAFIFAKAGTGTATFTNSGNSYTGGTVIQGGTLKLGAADVIPNVGTVTVRQEGACSTNGVLDLNGFSDTIAALSLGSTAATGTAGQTPMVINSGGPATLTLGGTVTYNAGNVAVPNGQATISANLSLGAANRTFAVNNSTGANPDLLVSGVISNGTGGASGITKTGSAGVLQLTGNNTFTGATIVSGSAGSTLRASANGALGATSAVTVQLGAILEVAGGGTTVNDLAPVTLGTAQLGGTVATLVTNSESFSTLTLPGNSVIDLGSSASIVLFANSAAQAWPGALSVWNWSGIDTVGGGTDQLFFGSDTSGLTGAQLASITFFSDAGITSLGTAVFATPGLGEVVPIPEPGTLGSLIGGFGVLLGLRRRRNHRRG